MRFSKSTYGPLVSVASIQYAAATPAISSPPYTNLTAHTNFANIISYAPLADVSRFPMPELSVYLKARRQIDPVIPTDNYTTGIYYVNPAEAWGKSRLIQPYAYWHKSRANGAESGAVDAFSDFLDAYHDDETSLMECKKDGVSAIRCFVYHFVGNANFKCREDQVHKCNIPSAYEVMNHISARFPEGGHLPNGVKITDSFQVTLGRQVLFTMLNFNEVLSTISSTQTLLLFTKEVFLRKATALVYGLSPQPDPHRQEQCQIFKDVMSFVVDQFKEKLQMTIKFFTGADIELPGGEVFDYKSDTIDYIRKHGEELKDEFDHWKQRLSYKGHSILSFNTWMMIYSKVRHIIEWGLDKNPNYVPPEYRGPPSSERGIPGEKLEFQDETAKGICGTIFGVAADNNAARTAALKDFVEQYSERMVRQTSDAFERLFVYDEENDPADMNLRLAMSLNYVDKAMEENSQTFYQNKQEIEQGVTNVIASELLAASRCFADCNERDDAQAVCQKSVEDYSKKDHGMAAEMVPDGNHFWCPVDRSNVVCRLSCYEKREAFNKKINLPQYVFSHGISMGALQNGSWNHFVQNQEPDQDTYASKNWITEGIISGAEETLRLPVCYSKHKRVELNDHFPFSCGGFNRTWDTSKTHDFLREINVQFVDENKMLAKKNMAQEIRTYWPAEHYMLLCHAGLRWPWKRTKGVEKPSVPVSIRRSMGIDPDCDRMEAELKYMDEKEANLHFCTSETGLRIQKREKRTLAFPAVVTQFKHKNSRATKRKCKNWLKGWKEEIPTLQLGVDEKYERVLVDIEAEMKRLEEERGEGDRTGREGLSDEELAEMDEREEEEEEDEDEEEEGEEIPVWGTDIDDTTFPAIEKEKNEVVGDCHVWGTSPDDLALPVVGTEGSGEVADEA